MHRKPAIQRPAWRQASFLAPLALAALSALLIAQQSAQAQPSGPPPGDGAGPRGGPPAEALAACKGLSSGAACSMSTPGGTLKGTCGAPEGKTLACRPSGPPPGAPSK